MSFQVLTLLPGAQIDLQLLDGERLDEVVLGVHDQGDPIVADHESRPLDALCLGLRFFIGLGRARGVDDVDLALQIAREAAAGPMVVHDHRDFGIDAVERLLRRLADPEHRARAVDDDRGRGLERRRRRAHSRPRRRRSRRSTINQPVCDVRIILRFSF